MWFLKVGNLFKGVRYSLVLIAVEVESLSFHVRTEFNIQSSVGIYQPNAK